MHKFVLRLVTVAMIATGIFSARPAAAAEMTWTMTSTYDYQVSVSFYSQSRSRSWPGGDEVYVLKDSRAHPFTLSCQQGEKICYGAWPTGGRTNKYWGVGRANANRCNSCCYICGESNPVRELTD